MAISLTKQFPEHQLSWKVLGSALKALGKLDESLIANQKAVDLVPNDAAAQFNLGNTLRGLGRIEEALARYEQAIHIDPHISEAHINLGNTLSRIGKFKMAEASYRKAIALKPGVADVHFNLGNALRALLRQDDAISSYLNAITINPSFQLAHVNLGISLQEQGQFHEALKSYKKAIILNPEISEVHYNMANCLKELGLLEEAEVSYKNAIKLSPNLELPHFYLGTTLSKLGRFDDAVTSYENALTLKPDLTIAHQNLCVTLLEHNKSELAFDAVIRWINVAPDQQAKSIFLEIIKRLTPQKWNDTLSRLIILALKEPFGRPSDAISFAIRLLKTDQEFIRILTRLTESFDHNSKSNALFNEFDFEALRSINLIHEILTSCPIPDTALEIFFTEIRRHFLDWSSLNLLKSLESDYALNFYCSLARQCFINEYVYFQSSEEVVAAGKLKDQLTKTLAVGGVVPDILVVVVACYFPLCSIEGARELLNSTWPSGVEDVIRQQIIEPMEEIKLRAGFTCLTRIENHVSLVVQNQYEENPYPRWVRLPKSKSKKSLKRYFQDKFSHLNFCTLADDIAPEILVAGCGTGQHPIGTACRVQGANILAIDLSLASLAYAKRMSIELGFSSIEYAQADILQLASLDRRFDVIESAGVLHHLDNPFEGWRVLHRLLKPRGFMLLGFYSEIGRRDVVRLRNLVDKGNVPSSAEQIRNFRSAVMNMENSDEYGLARASLDFYSTSACRDLLFHVQEHQMNLDMISNFINENDMKFLGFEYLDSSVRVAYRQRFPHDFDGLNLDNWQTFETENPSVFFGMYQFWVQKGNV